MRCRTLLGMAVAMLCVAAASVQAGVDSAAGPAGAASVQAEYEQVVTACRKLPPDRDRMCVEEAKKKYGELLRSRS
jgi:hypothetical protein